jgi:hypothetical protein
MDWLHAEWHFITPVCCLIVDKVLEEMGDIHWGMCYSHQQKIHKFRLTASSGGFEYGTMVV